MPALSPGPGARRSLAPGRRTVLGSLLALAVAAAACTNGPPASQGTTGSTSTSDAPSTIQSTTTTTAPPASYDIGKTVFHWVDYSRQTVNGSTPSQPISGRVLTTEVLYPTRGGSVGRETPGAAPASLDGPFPVIAFAHGFDVSPPYYAPLLDSWVSAGFIVVAPYFPDENTKVVSKVGPTSTVGETDEFDLANEPSDIAFVLRQFFQAVQSGAGPLTPGLARTGSVGLAGQSDGGDVVADLAFGSAFGESRATMPSGIGAVAILSGASWCYGPAPDPDSQPCSNGYGASTVSPPVLQVQSRTDTCNPPGDAAQLFNSLSSDPVHIFETLRRASHLEPYSVFYPGNPYLPIVASVTTKFFEAALSWRSSPSDISSVTSAGTVPGLSFMSPVPPHFPQPKKPVCPLPRALRDKLAPGAGGTAR